MMWEGMAIEIMEGQKPLILRKKGFSKLIPEAVRDSSNILASARILRTFL